MRYYRLWSARYSTVRRSRISRAIEADGGIEAIAYMYNLIGGDDLRDWRVEAIEIPREDYPYYVAHYNDGVFLGDK